MKIEETLKKRLVEDTVNIGERTFKVKNFDPLMGNYIIMNLLTMVLPFGISDIISAKVGIPKTADSAKMMPKLEFMEMQRDILAYAFEELAGRTAPVINENGSYGISDFTMPIALQLIVAVIAFNFSDFFDDGLFKNISG